MRIRRVLTVVSVPVPLLLLHAGVGISAPGAIAEAEAVQVTAQGAKRKVVFVAGKRSHAYGTHDHWPGSLLLSKWLNENHPQIEAVVTRDVD